MLAGTSRERVTCLVAGGNHLLRMRYYRYYDVLQKFHWPTLRKRWYSWLISSILFVFLFFYQDQGVAYERGGASQPKVGLHIRAAPCWGVRVRV